MSHAAEAERLLAEAERIRNADHWKGDRDLPSLAAATMAQVEATLAIVEQVARVADRLEDGRGFVVSGSLVTKLDAP